MKRTYTAEALTQKHQRLSRVLMIIGLSLLLVLSTTGSAFAVAWGNNSSFTTAGRTYYGASGATGLNGTGTAYQRVYVSGNTMPQGYGGVQPQLYTGSSLQQSSSWRYNPSDYSGGVAFQSSVQKYLGRGINCRAKGYFAGWMSPGNYATMQSTYSPYQTC